jgi:hypothetical protein
MVDFHMAIRATQRTSKSRSANCFSSFSGIAPRRDQPRHAPTGRDNPRLAATPQDLCRTASVRPRAAHSHGLRRASRVRARELIRSRTGEGRARAVANGMTLGCRPFWRCARERRRSSGAPLAGNPLARLRDPNNVSRWTISRLAI